MHADLKDKPTSLKVVGIPVTALDFKSQITLIMQWAKQRESRSVCVANVHMLVEAHRDAAFANVLEQADLVTPDGMPLVWMLRWLGNPHQDRVAGLDIMLSVCAQAIEQNISIFLLGSEPEILQRMTTKFHQEFPQLKLAGAESLPFRPLTDAENAAIVKKINQSGAGLVLVSLGCPKQETWIAKHQGIVDAVMIGLGGAFPVYAGLKKRAPRLIQGAGLEWLYRLIQEPRRLWWRYSSTIPMFLWLALKQLWSSRSDLDKDLVEIN